MMEPSRGEFRLARISEIREEISDVKTFVLSMEANYNAGQFLTVLSPDGTQRRSYSFSTSPETGGLPAITVKRVANGILSRYLIDQVKVGDEICVAGPSGLFTLPTVFTHRQVVFLAAGIGITPVYSLLQSLLATRPSVPATLIYSNSSPESTVFLKELTALQSQHQSQLTIEFLFSNSPDLSRARLNKQFLPQLLHEHLKAEPDETLFYLCGPFAYMRMVQFALEEEHIPSENIRKENFSTAVITHKVAPPDKETYPVTVHYQGKAHNFFSAYPDTILSAARKHGINLPYSCENGICGSCVAQCNAGSVWHRNNEVLTDAELKAGLTLTCTSYPICGPVELTIK